MYRAGVLALPAFQPAKAYLFQATTFLLSVALAAIDLDTDLRKLWAKGWKRLLAGAGSWLFISAFSLALIKLSYG
jgi:uncharacterized membrane protein YadS